MIGRKKIIIIAACALLFITIIVAVVTPQPTDQEISTTDDTAMPFTINNLDSPEYLFSSDTQAAIVLGIEQYLKADDIKTEGTEGVIRKNSYTKKEEMDTTISTILIDIPSAKRTYKISSSGSGTPNGDNSLYILCPSQNELMYGAFDCKDDLI